MREGTNLGMGSKLSHGRKWKHIPNLKSEGGEERLRKAEDWIRPHVTRPIQAPAQWVNGKSFNFFVLFCMFKLIQNFVLF